MIFGLPEHNPKPSTRRGKRRHNQRPESDKRRAERAWNEQRSTRSREAGNKARFYVRPTQEIEIGSNHAVDLHKDGEHDYAAATVHNRRRHR